MTSVIGHSPASKRRSMSDRMPPAPPRRESGVRFLLYHQELPKGCSLARTALAAVHRHTAAQALPGLPALWPEDLPLPSAPFRRARQSRGILTAAQSVVLRLPFTSGLSSAPAKKSFPHYFALAWFRMRACFIGNQPHHREQRHQWRDRKRPLEPPPGKDPTHDGPKEKSQV